MNQAFDGGAEGTAGILRAIGSLLDALAGGDIDPARAAAAAAPTASAGSPLRQSLPTQVDAPVFHYAPPPMGAPRPASSRLSASAGGTGRRRATEPDAAPIDSTDIDLILSDARERAQRIIDESVERARELLTQDRPAPVIDPEVVTEVRRSVRDLVVEVRDIQQRLARIETLLHGERAERIAASDRPLPTFVPPIADAPVYQPTDQASPAFEPVTKPAEPLVAYQPHTPEPAAAEPLYEPESPAAATYQPPAYEPPHEITPDPAPVYDAPAFGEPATPYEPPAVTSYEPPAVYEPSAALAPEFAPEPSQPPYQTPYQSDGDREEPPAASAARTIPSPAPAPPRSPFSVVPPQRREWAPDPSIETAPPVDIPAPPPSAIPRMRQAVASMPVADPAWADPEPIADDSPTGDESDAPIATFLPDDGAILLRVAPVSGFQGLMRVQDALARLPSVRQAAVEAYSQGEARLRIELSEPTDSDEIAAGLTRSLKEPARVQRASEADRELLIALR